MDEYQGMERFGTENDYEDGQWIGGEFYYRKRREKRQQTKEDVLYGVFADSDSDDDSSSRKRGRKDRLTSSTVDLTKPVNFVSTGTVMPNREIDRNVEERNGDDDGRPSGLGFNSNQGSGLGFGKEPKAGAESGMQGGVRRGSGDDEEEDDFLPTAFGQRIKEGAARREREQREKQKSEKKSSRGRAESEFGNMGGFERHTKGIGMKLLEKMGYKGGGLGKNEQGILSPVEAKLRPKNMGMGFNDYKEAKMPALEEPRKEDSSATPVLSQQAKEKLWKRNRNRGRRKEKKYITAEELLAQKEEQGLEVVQKVLDMRGPQVRVLTNLENLNAEEKAKENQVPMPELQHNVRLIVDMAELDIQKIDRDLRHERETVASLQTEKERLQEEAILQKKQLDAMEEILATLDRLGEANLLGALTLDSLAMTFHDLQKKFADDYKMCNLSCIACSYALQLMFRVFQGWDPLQNPSYGLEVMSLWKSLLEGDDPHDYSDVSVASPYAQLMMEVILPAIRISGTNTWKARDPEPMLRFLESWEKLLPPVVLHSVLENVVMPKLSDAVQSWDPRRETVPIHVWVHPWLPLMGQRLEILYLTIREKLGNALHAWHASDSSAFAILSPWKTVFDPASWELLIARYIVPKLMVALQEFEVNPANQKLDQFSWVMRWASAIPIHHMVTMLETSFFTKWQQVLYHWLCSHPNFEEVTQWFLGWKGLFPAELLANERIRYQLNVGLEMMNQAVEGMEVVQPGARENISYLRATEKRQYEAQQQAAAYGQRHTSAGSHADGSDGQSQLSLKEILENCAQDNNLIFKPKQHRTHDGLPVYGFGNISICVDHVKQKIFAQTEDGWRVVTLEWLLDMHRNQGVPHY
ncbi:hypothetical protein ACLOJK_021698 [Asimina triloba]